MSLRLPRCDICKHLHIEKTEDYCCDAFPDRIPLEKITFDYDNVEDCNNGIKYEKE